MIKAALDIGTNSVRLLVADWRGQGLMPLYKGLITTRLGEGVEAEGVLGEEPMHRTVTALAQLVAKGRELGAEEFVAVATSAVRDAANRKAFVAECYKGAGVVVKVLDGPTEARFSYTGALDGQLGTMDVAVVDIGGGSTEVVAGRGTKLQWAESFNIGAVRLSELYPADEEGKVGNFSALKYYIEEVLEKLEFCPPPEKMLGVGGTITSLAAINQRLTVYDSAKVHGYALLLSDVEEWLIKLAEMPLVVRQTTPGLQRDRADIIVYGTAILVQVMKATKLSCITVSEHDILEGAIICQDCQ